MEQGKIETLKKILENSKYTVALCGSGMMEEGGYVGVKLQNRAYDIEQKYGTSPEYLFSSAYYHTRPEQFFEFYKKEMLEIQPDLTESAKALARMEAAGRLQCTITANIYDLPRKAGCRNVINLHGSIYENKCPHCGKQYSLEFIKQTKAVPLCENCGSNVRPLVALFGEQLNSQLVAQTTTEVEKADVLLILGTTLKSEVFANYIRYFDGSKLVVIHQRPHHADQKADMVIIDQPMNVLPLLGY